MASNADLNQKKSSSTEDAFHNSNNSNRTSQRLRNPSGNNNKKSNQSGNHSSHHHHSNNSNNNNYGNNNKRNQSIRPVRKKNNNYFNERPVFTCIVCCQDLPSFKLKAILEVGQCDHMICYYCSTKMRVLCEQNECPTCRQELSEVIFTTNKDLKFTKLETKRCVEYNSRYKIYFENEQCLTEFHRLLEFRCQICFNDETLFSNLKELEVHLRKEHDLYICELCVDHLKIFSSERKYYSRKDLTRHKKTGDPDNKSYKGHCSCHLCDTMFFDEDELLSQLKKDHYSCHFCDPTRTKMFFDNYQSLKQHFLDQHHICQEGFCRDEEITSAFANKFDLAAHKAQVHGSKVNRAAARVDFDIDFTQNGLPQTTVSYTHSNHHAFVDLDSSNEVTFNQSVPTQEDFPQLASASNVCPGGSNYAITAKNVTGLKKTTKFGPKFLNSSSNTEDFPALAIAPSSGNGGVPSFAQKKFSSLKPKQPTIASLKKSKTSKNNQPQQQASNLKYAEIASNYPPLANVNVNESWNKPLPPSFNQDDLPDMPIKMKKTKKKTQYVNTKKEAELQKQKREEEKILEQLKKAEEEQPQNNANNSSLPNPFTNDGKMLSLKVPPGLHKLTQKEQMNNIKRMPPPGFSSNSQTNEQWNEDSIVNSKSVEKPEENTFNMNLQDNATNELSQPRDDQSQTSRSKPAESNNKNSNHKNASNKNNGNGTAATKNLPSSTRTGYIYPSNFNERNESLLRSIKHELGTEDRFDRFRYMTDKFIRDHVEGDLYFRKCLDLFGKNFLNLVFSELLVLMPHIKKQKEILAAYERYFNYSKGSMQNKRNNRDHDGSKGVWILTNEKIEFLVCPVCQQVLSKEGKDGSEHMSNHGDLTN